jgi:hypothetical protein
MNLSEAIRQPYSLQQKLRVANYVGDNPQRFDELMQVFLTSDDRIAQRCSNFISHCVERQPGLITKYLDTLIAQLKKSASNAVRRNIVRLLQFVAIPDTLAGNVMDACFQLIQNSGEPVANKTFALTVLANLSRQYPDIKPELRLVIEDQLPRTTTAFHARARKLWPALVRG